MLIREIADTIGVPKSTVMRWCNPKLENRERARARRKKFSQRRRCPNCGQKMSDLSALCLSCARAGQRYWTRERVVRALREWAAKHGKVPATADWQRGRKDHPNVRSVTGPGLVFNSWAELLEAAGFGPWVKAKRRKLTPYARKALRRELREETLRLALEKGDDVQTEEAV